MHALRRFVGLVALLAAEVAVVWLLHRLGTLPWLRVGWGDPAAWLAVVPAEDAVVAALRLVALAGAYWLVVTTVCYALARASRLPGAVRSVRWATLPAVRRVADRAVAVALTGTTMAVGAPGLAAAVVPPPALRAPADLPGASPAPPVDLLPGASPAPPVDLLPGASPAPPVDLPASPAPTAPPPAEGAAAGEEPPARADPATAHVVAAGDNLWAITAGVLGEGATDAEVHAHWQAVIAANRDRLRSADPDLIYPGERLVLPPQEPSASG